MEDINVYDEDKAVAFIRKAVPAAVSDKCSDDDILFIIDTIWDYYESKGLTSRDAELTDDEIADPSELTRYVANEVKKDGVLMLDSADLEEIVKAELQYEETLDIFAD